MIMATSNMAAVSRAGASFDGPTDGGVPIVDFLTTLAFLVGTTAFYEIFTERTGIPVGDIGRVEELEWLECPDWFLRKLLDQLVAFGRNHSNNLLQEFGGTDPALSLALTASCARRIAELLAQSYATRLVDAGMAQIDSADEFVELGAGELNPDLLPG
jgi:hypothetical protein